MHNNPVGACPHCGAPIYFQSPWYGDTPPPLYKTCGCVPNVQQQQHSQCQVTFQPNPTPMSKSSNKALDALTKAMEENGLIQDKTLAGSNILADKINQLENTVQELANVVKSLVVAGEKNECNCKKKSKTILKEEIKT